MTVIEALQLIIKNSHVPALNYCISYAEYALDISDRCDIEQDREFKTQLLYVLNNMSRWRQCKASTTTAAEIKECRAVLKKRVYEYAKSIRHKNRRNTMYPMW